MRLKFIIEAVIFSVFVMLLYIGTIGIMAYLRRKHYTPDIMDQYESVDYISHQTATGVQFDINSLPYVFIMLILLCTGYLAVRISCIKWLWNSKGRDGK